MTDMRATRVLYASLVVAALWQGRARGDDGAFQTSAADQFAEDGGMHRVHQARFQTDEAQYPRHLDFALPVMSFPLGALLPSGDWPAEENGPLPYCQFHDAPCLATTTIRVVNIPLDQQVFIDWEKNVLRGWMDPGNLTPAVYRLGDWWVIVSIHGDRLVTELGHRYPEDPETVRAQLRHVQGYEPSDRSVADHISAGATLNRDLEAWVANHGFYLSEARAAEEHVAIDLLRQLCVAYFQVFAVAAQNTRLAIDTGATGPLRTQSAQRGARARSSAAHVAEAERSAEPLPRVNEVQVDAAKFERYSMDPGNAQNGGKWKAFKAVGYDVGTPEGRKTGATDVIRQVQEQLPTAATKHVKASHYGPRFKVEFQIEGPSGKKGTLVTEWQIDQGKEVPRLITNWLEVHR